MNGPAMKGPALNGPALNGPAAGADATVAYRNPFVRLWVESRLVLVGLVLAFWTLLPLYHMAVLSITPV